MITRNTFMTVSSRLHKERAGACRARRRLPTGAGAPRARRRVSCQRPCELAKKPFSRRGAPPSPPQLAHGASLYPLQVARNSSLAVASRAFKLGERSDACAPTSATDQAHA